MNWTEPVLSARRSDMSVLTSRRELTGTPACTSSSARTRWFGAVLHRRDGRLLIPAAPAQANRHFWDRVVVVTSKDTDLTKVHGRRFPWVGDLHRHEVPGVGTTRGDVRR